MTEKGLVWGSKHAVQHRREVLHSDVCGCFHCLALFEPSTIRNWIDDGQTALCPHCGMDSVVGAESGFDVRGEFLSAMQGRWFPPAKSA